MRAIRQLICVQAGPGPSARLTARQRQKDGRWTPFLSVPADIGAGGVCPAICKREGDRCTPAGLYPLGTAFSTEPAVPFAWACRTITPASWWVDDPESPLYNQWVETDRPAGFASAEHLMDQPVAYRYGVAIGYNTDPVIPGRGAAIFLHCCDGTGRTLGCVAVPEPAMLRVLVWLDPAAAPHIRIDAFSAGIREKIPK